MNPKLRRILLAVFSLIFVISLGGFINSLLDYRQGEQVNAEANALVELPDITPLPPQADQNPTAADPQADPEPYVDPYADALAAMDFAALRQVNREVLGWIIIPDTGISYPLLHHSNNQFYLGHNWKGGSSRVGSIFLEAANSPGLGDFNTIIYGHRMNNGSMFTPLQKFQKQDFWAAHPSVYITTDAGSLRYDIFAAYEVSTEGLTYALGFSGDKAKQRFIDFCLEQSVLKTEVVPEVQDYILTLSTCTGRGHATRWVVQAVRRGEKPAEPEPTPDDNQSDNPADTPTEGNNQSDNQSPAPTAGNNHSDNQSPIPTEGNNQTDNQPLIPTEVNNQTDNQPPIPTEGDNQTDNQPPTPTEGDNQAENPPDMAADNPATGAETQEPPASQ